MNNKDQLLSESGWLAFHQAQQIQLVFMPELELGFYQSLLDRAQTEVGIHIELILGYPHTQHNALLTPEYYQSLIQHGAQVFFHPGQRTLLPMLMLDGQIYIPEKPHLPLAGLRLLPEAHPDNQNRIKRYFQQCKENSIMPSNVAQVQGSLWSKEEQSFTQNINIRFFATPNEVSVYQHFELKWEVTGAQEVHIDPLLGAVQTSGRKVLSAEKTLEFRLTASNAEQTLSSILKVEVDPKPYLEYLLIAIGTPQQEDMILRADPAYPDRYGVIQGQVLRLNWRALNTQELYMDGAEVPLLGQMLLKPQQLSAHYFVAKGATGDSLHRSIVIDVIPQADLGPLSLTIPESLAWQTMVGLPPLASQSVEQIKEPSSNAMRFESPSNLTFTPSRPDSFNLRNFLWFCSGASRDILLQCPKFEQNKFLGMGVTVLCTGLLAALSGGYALYVAFQSVIAALLFALLWGGAIFNLDRLLVSSIKKEMGVINQIIQTIPRLVLALGLSLVIAKPLEIRIFQPEIAEILAISKAEKIQNIERQYQSKINTLNDQIDQLKAETLASFQVRENLYQEYRCECDGTCGTGITGRGSECARKEAKYQQSNEEYLELKISNERLISGLRQETLTLKQQNQSSQSELKSTYSEGLVARIAAANQLPFWPSFFITMLIFLIEITPVLSKVLMPAGPYDKALQVQEQSFARQQDSLLQVQDAQNQQKNDLRTQQQELEVEQQIERNREILRLIAGAQIQLIRDQVERWMERERKKL